MATRWIHSGLVSVDTPLRQPRTSDKRKHTVRKRWVEPRPPIDREQLKRNTLRNEGLRAHNDTRARLYMD